MNTMDIFYNSSTYTKIKPDFYYKIIAFLIFIFPLTSAINTIMPISLNRFIVFGLIFLIIVFEFFYSTFSLFDFILIFYLLIVLAISSISTDSIYLVENFEDFIYFASTILFISIIIRNDFCSKIYKVFQQNTIFFKSIIYITLVIIMISFFTNVGYDIDGAFKGFMVSTHAMASTCILLLSMCLFFKIKNPIPYLLCSFFIFESEARTFLIPLSIIVLIYIHVMFKKKSIKYMLLISIIIFVTVFFTMTDMYKKFYDTYNNPYSKDVMAGLSNGRTIFWKADLNSYSNDYNLLERFIGKSFSWVKSINYSITLHRIWAHNDFINLLLSVGVLGVLVYSIVLTRLFIKVDGLFYKIMLFCFTIIPGLLNGFYMYYALVLSVVLLFYIPKIYLKKQVNNNENINCCKSL